MLKLHIYSNETGRQVAAIEGTDNAECEALAEEQWNSNDYHWSYVDQRVSNAICES